MARNASLRVSATRVLQAVIRRRSFQRNVIEAARADFAALVEELEKKTIYLDWDASNRFWSPPRFLDEGPKSSGASSTTSYLSSSKSRIGNFLSGEPVQQRIVDFPYPSTRPLPSPDGSSVKDEMEGERGRLFDLVSPAAGQGRRYNEISSRDDDFNRDREWAAPEAHTDDQCGIPDRVPRAPGLAADPIFASGQSLDLKGESEALSGHQRFVGDEREVAGVRDTASSKSNASAEAATPNTPPRSETSTRFLSGPAEMDGGSVRSHPGDNEDLAARPSPNGSVSAAAILNSASLAERRRYGGELIGAGRRMGEDISSLIEDGDGVLIDSFDAAPVEDDDEDDDAYAEEYFNDASPLRESYNDGNDSGEFDPDDPLSVAFAAAARAVDLAIFTGRPLETRPEDAVTVDEKACVGQKEDIESSQAILVSSAEPVPDDLSPPSLSPPRPSHPQFQGGGSNGPTPLLRASLSPNSRRRALEAELAWHHEALKARRKMLRKLQEMKAVRTSGSSTDPCI